MQRKACICGFALLLVACVLTGCAAGPNVLKDSPNSDGDLAGFWLGLWHGMILPLAFVISLFSANLSIYEVHNSGALYNFGFLLGAGMVWGGGGAAARPRVDRGLEDDEKRTIGENWNLRND